jgi:hypothetical protein
VIGALHLLFTGTIHVSNAIVINPINAPRGAVLAEHIVNLLETHLSLLRVYPFALSPVLNPGDGMDHGVSRTVKTSLGRNAN